MRVEQTHLLRIQVLLPVPRHVLGQAYRLVADGDGVLDNSLKLVDGVAWAELPGVGVHCECHFGGRFKYVRKSALKERMQKEW